MSPPVTRVTRSLHCKLLGALGNPMTAYGGGVLTTISLLVNEKLPELAVLTHLAMVVLVVGVLSGWRDYGEDDGR